VHHILKHPAVLKSPAFIRNLLRRDLAAFLHAHVTQIADNERMTVNTGSGEPCIRNDGDRTFHSWVRDTGADHTSCPMSFTFCCYLIAEHDGKGFPSGAKHAYLTADLRLHLAAMCRMYNDYGSERRDRRESNLNCLDFPEFKPKSTLGSIDGTSDGTSDGTNEVNSVNGHQPKDTTLSDQKAELLWIVEYERRCLTLAFDKLKDTGISTTYVRALQLFIDVTDLFGQLYVARDIGIAQKPGVIATN
ncbi:hypothetical protein K469DRAFT_779002, partial [Zopfia rhizophila CBS 207.26]